MPSYLPFRRVCLLWAIFLFFQLVSAEAFQSVATFGLGQRTKKGAQPPDTGEAPKPQLLNADSNPTLRYPVAVSESSISCGWLDLTRTGASYTVVESGGRGKMAAPARSKFAPGGVQYMVAPEDSAGGGGFEVSFSEIQDNRLLEGSFLRLAFAGRKPLLIYLSKDYWETVAGRPRAFKEFGLRMPAGTAAIERALQNFDSVLAEVKPPAPPSVDVSLHAEPPTVEKGRPVALVWNSSNATSLDLEPGVGRVATAGGISVAPQDSTNYTLTATGPGGSKVASVFVSVTQSAPVSPPTIVLTEPSSAGDGQTVEVSSSPLTIRGVVMDATGIPVVSVNGKSVTMRPTSPQAAQFTSDPLTLQPGENRFEVSATNSAHGQAKVSFVARFTASTPKAPPVEANNSKALGKAEILSLLQGDVTSARVAELVKERGIKFVPTPDDLNDIRKAGGTDTLIDAINQASPPARN
jgi:hypothetical protein